MRQTLRGRRETIVNRREIRCQICLRAPLHCCSAIDPEDTGDPDARLLLEALGYADPADVGKSGSGDAPPCPPADGGVAVCAGFRTGRARRSRSGLLWRRIRSGDGRPLACRQSRRSAFPASVFRCRKRFRDVSARASSIFPSCRPGSTCWNGSVRAIRLPGSVRRHGNSSPRSRRTACAPMPNFHGTASRGLPMVARSCCRQICACAGRRTSKRSSRRFR